MSYRPRESPPLPVPGPDARVLARIMSRLELEDPEEAITAHLTPIWPRRRKPGRRRARRAAP